MRQKRGYGGVEGNVENNRLDRRCKSFGSSDRTGVSTRCASYFGSLLYILYCIVLYLLCLVFSTRVTVL